MKSTKEELAALYDAHQGGRAAIDANYHQGRLDAKRRVWAREHQQWLDLDDAISEGLFEVTVRSRTMTVTLAISGAHAAQISSELLDTQTDLLRLLEGEILQHALLLEEEEEDRAGTSPSQKIFGLCQARPGTAYVPAAQAVREFLGDALPAQRAA